MPNTCLIFVYIQIYGKTWRFIILGRSLSYFYLEFIIIYLQRCSSSFHSNRSLIFSISSTHLFSHHVSVARVSINPFLNFLCFIFLVSFPQNHYTNYIKNYATGWSKQLIFKKTIFIYGNSKCLLLWNRRYKKSQFQKYVITCASMVQNHELKQTIHRYRGVVMNAVRKILDIFPNIFFSLVNSLSKINFC